LPFSMFIIVLIYCYLMVSGYCFVCSSVRFEFGLFPLSLTVNTRNGMGITRVSMIGAFVLPALVSSLALAFVFWPKSDQKEAAEEAEARETKRRDHGLSDKWE